MAFGMHTCTSGDMTARTDILSHTQTGMLTTIVLVTPWSNEAIINIRLRPRSGAAPGESL